MHHILHVLVLKTVENDGPVERWTVSILISSFGAYHAENITRSLYQLRISCSL